MPVLFEQNVDRTELTFNIAKALFKNFDFNPGQQSIINSANFDGYVNQNVTYDIKGDIWNISSKITSYNLNIDVSHPEAVDESLSSVLEDTRGYIYDLFESEDFIPRGSLSENSINNNINFDRTLMKIGLFV